MAVDGDDDCIAFAPSFVCFHAFLLSGLGFFRFRISASELGEMRKIFGEGRIRTGLSKRVIKIRSGWLTRTTAAQSLTRMMRPSLPLMRIKSLAPSRKGC